jgi:hypothetical protein
MWHYWLWNQFRLDLWHGLRLRLINRHSFFS